MQKMRSSFLSVALTAVVLALHSSHTVSSRHSGSEHTLCRSRVASLRFNNTLPPHAKSSWEPLIACRSFASHTCCSRNDSEAIKRLNLMSSAAGFTAKCRQYYERFNCMPCDGDVGTGLKASACSSFCDEWYGACREEFHKTAIDGSTLRPCFGTYLICSPLKEIVSSGEELCQTMGVSVSEDPERCYDGSVSGKKGVPEPRPPNDDIEIGGFRFQKGQAGVASVVHSLKKAWDQSSQLEVAVAFACISTATFLMALVGRSLTRALAPGPLPSRRAAAAAASRQANARKTGAAAAGSPGSHGSIFGDDDDSSSSDDDEMAQS